MIYLYLKTHNETGLKYLGKTQSEPYKYKGSGIYWRRHLEKYGNNVDTEILKVCKDNEEVKFWGSFYSKKWDIVNSNSFANLKEENGDGGSFPHTDETKEKLREIALNASDETKIKISETLKKHYSKRGGTFLGKTHTEETKEKISKKNKGRKDSLETRIKKGNKRRGKKHTSEAKQKISESNKGKFERYSETSKQNVKNAMRANSSKKINCPFCGKESNLGNAKRWHFDNCKYKE